MFTGLIESIGSVIRLTRSGAGARLVVDLGRAAEGVEPGDSVAVDGACLTATRIDGVQVEFDVSAETLAVATTGALKPGDKVNLERALRVGDRLGGHFVLGHVDCIGRIAGIAQTPGQATLTVEVPREVAAQMIRKGSVTVDGISLTLASLEAGRFSVALIPTTLRETTLHGKSSGDRVNIELDVLGKYVARLLNKQSPGTLTEGFLHEHGF